MRTLLSSALLAACGGSSTSAPTTTATRPAAAATVKVDRYAAAESDVNAYVLSDGAGTILIDATRNGDDARKLLALARQTGHDPSLVFITHGHPDHFWGLAALRAELPDLRVVVASEAIKQDIVGFATWAAGQGWMEKIPEMKPRTAENPGGFDYDSIDVLDGDTLTLPGGATLAVKSDYAPTEAAHETTLYSKELGALFTGDLAYEGVHLWLGSGVTLASAAEWQRTGDALAAAYPATTTVYPGHGAPTTPAVFATDRAYIDAILDVAKSAASDQAGIEAMAAKYPDWKNRDFLLMMSITNLRALTQGK